MDLEGIVEGNIQNCICENNLGECHHITYQIQQSVDNDVICLLEAGTQSGYSPDNNRGQQGAQELGYQHPGNSGATAHPSVRGAILEMVSRLCRKQMVKTGGDGYGQHQNSRRQGYVYPAKVHAII